MAEDGIKSLNDLIEKLRSGKIEGEIEVIVRSKGTENHIFIKSQEESVGGERTTIELADPSVRNINLSRTDLSGSNFYGMDLRGVDFSYARITNADMSRANLSDANFYKAILSQTSLANAYNISMQQAYLTGSVNLYNAATPEEIKLSRPSPRGLPSGTENRDFEATSERPRNMTKRRVAMEDTAPQHRKDDYWG